ncbi:uncharacterized protein LACBIDRAFT_315524 [Laccaria bicolor S238N-H82]|uniref:Predicted protein n=1 Tax=Laccaria bicolor (strain S238N-H82 / ATCC MYA-4686) TaxID=486041 RepID=B0D2K7_LACBS|nr:uncharacterized protein LACBIDRAFT_315524 [Laccaria bicolor S238N-H82]EDR11113.1 predicted protein [Laccaria bicolor S238N-H82]|eukprot:XP_001878414.1 predicted protein [Laccaria bicolor S238N-H82]
MWSVSGPLDLLNLPDLHKVSFIFEARRFFAHEHALYPPKLLPIHLPSMHHRPGKTALKYASQIEGGIHSLCGFCRERFFSGDELYPHMREKHEECFLCKRNEVRDQYFINYESLERHFNSIHHPCTQKECQAQNFVVFNSPLDLRAHMVEVHGGRHEFTRQKGR